MIGAMTVITLTRYSHHDKNNGILKSAILLFIYLYSPIFFAQLIWQFRDRLDEPKIKQRMGSLYNGLRPEKDGNTTYSSTFLIRRAFFVLLTFSLLSFPALQIQIFLLSCLFYLIYLNIVITYEEKLHKWVNNYNEWLFICVLYHLILFCDMIHDKPVRDQVGESLIFTLSLALITNFAVIIYVNVMALKQLFRKRYL